MHFPNGVSLSLSLFIILVSRSVWPSWFMGDGIMIVWNARRYTLQRYPHARRTSAHRYTEHECFRMRFHLNMMRKRLMTIYTIISLHITNSALLLDKMIFMFGRWCKRAFSYPFPFLFHSTSNIEFASFAIHLIVCAASFFFFAFFIGDILSSFFSYYSHFHEFVILIVVAPALVNSLHAYSIQYEWMTFRMGQNIFAETLNKNKYEEK